MAKVEFKNVDKVFPNDVQALQEFNLDVADGEFMVLVGPSGCGKSTALRMLAGLEKSTKGEILINGEIVNDTSPQKRNIAMVFQNYALYPHMTVRGNLEFPLKMMKATNEERDRQIQQTAELLSLTELLDRRPKQLSGGQRQRVAMGRALVRNPQVFLMDEPLSNLDAKLRVQIRSDIAGLQKKMATTTIYVTHDQVEAMTLGHKVAVLNEGRIQQVDTPQKLYQSPANIFVADFIGSPGMNLFETILQNNAHGQLCITLNTQLFPVPDSVKKKYPKSAHYLDRKIIVGLRPETFSFAKLTPSQIGIQMTITSIEPLGHETLLFFKSPLTALTADTFSFLDSFKVQSQDASMVARLPGSFSFPAYSQQEIFMDMQKMFLFDERGWQL